MTFPANELARVSTVKSRNAGGPETPRDFERLLREHGFSRSRAKAITAKGFGGFENHADEALIAEMVAELRNRRSKIEEKSIGKLSFNVAVGWSRWYRFPAITAVKPGHVKIKAFSTNIGRLKGPFELTIRHVVPGGRTKDSQWLSHGGISSNGPYAVAEGIQEIQVRGKAGNIPQNIIVELDWSR